ncbi:YheT family hydrolase [Kingella pumchi]|uniref:Alpha/beta fold hydrolase n=1 Tax=Kingella pumchi TaxID=2779506 RepID=A0ABS9NKA8_9NEIS|nr:alpha/beta fold hydrolase [Kingella pumchi]MCG6503105.1 alpha/beta fold hydrolase [Kingella pumchi]
MNPHDLLQQLPPLQAPPWLKGGHAQTLYAKALQSPPPAYRRELLPDSYGEDLAAYDFVDAADPDAPLVVLFHGLEGSSTSHYAVELMHRVRAHGWHGVVAHFRSCGGVASKRLYHSGDSREAAHMLALLAARYRKIYAVGVSLGGNVLAKYLGEQGAAALPAAAATVSSPLDLGAGSRLLESGLSRLLYTPYFMHTLMGKVPAGRRRFCRSLAEFDNRYTAPLHGFADKDDYYAQSSAKPLLKNIAVPTLLLNARNDPFVPADSLPTAADISPSVCLLQPEHGGHCGFVSGGGRGHLRWLPDTLLAFFDGLERRRG